MAGILSLSNELLIEICEYFDDIPNLRAISATSRLLHYIANPMLYSLAAKCFPYLLGWACEFGRLDVVEKLLVFGVNPNTPAVRRRYYIDTDAGDSSTALRGIYSHDIHNAPYDPNNEQLRPPIYNPRQYPTVEGYVVALQRFTDNNWDRTQDFLFPLHGASMSGSIEIVQTLIKAGAYLDLPSMNACRCRRDGMGENFSSDSYWTPLHAGLCCGHEAIANLLIRSGSSPIVEYRIGDTEESETDEPETDEPETKNQSTALHWAARGNNMSTVQHLLKYTDIDINAQSPNGGTPLMWALGTPDSIKMMDYLVKHGANVDVQLSRASPKMKGTALGYACRMGWHKEANFLIDAGANIYNRSRRCPSALDQSLLWLGGLVTKRDWKELDSILGDDTSYREHLELVNKGERRERLQFQPEMKKNSDATDFAAMLELVWKLIRKGAKTRRHWFEECSPLIRACRAHLVSVVEYLLSLGIGVNRKEAGTFPLTEAVLGRRRFGEAEQYQIISLLLKHGAAPNKKDKQGGTILVYLCNKRVPRAGRSRFGRETVSQATSDHLMSAHIRIAELLINHGADVNVQYTPCNWKGRPKDYQSSPLEAAMQHQKWSLCEYLKGRGAKIDFDMENGTFRRVLHRLAHEVADIRDNFNCEEDIIEEQPRHEFDIDPNICHAIGCRAMRLLDIDDAKVQCLAETDFYGYLKLASKIDHTPLMKMLLDAGISGHDHWGYECIMDVIDRILRGDTTVDLDCLRQLVDIEGCEEGTFRIPDHIFEDPEILSSLADGGIERYIDSLAVLVGDGAKISRDGITNLELLIGRNGNTLECKLRSDLKRRIQQRFTLENGWIFARDDHGNAAARIDDGRYFHGYVENTDKE
ncbi:ankyrin repeat-containing domain protein [Hypomontagnella monticulosa]|nr:ankyrin repeat-containing domain protein [Hypomontagnella monticulosa]